MEKPDAAESAAIITRMMDHLAKTISPTAGAIAATARTAIGDLVAQAYMLLYNDAIGEPLDNCFDLARQAGCSITQMENVRRWISAEKQPTTLGAPIIKKTGMELCLAQEVLIILDMTFTSRQDVDAIKATLSGPFGDMEEIAADTMDQATYQA